VSFQYILFKIFGLLILKAAPERAWIASSKS
jgi:hypothetical protein